FWMMSHSGSTPSIWIVPSSRGSSRGLGEKPILSFWVTSPDPRPETRDSRPERSVRQPHVPLALQLAADDGPRLLPQLRRDDVAGHDVLDQRAVVLIGLAMDAEEGRLLGREAVMALQALGDERHHQRRLGLAGQLGAQGHEPRLGPQDQLGPV